MIDLTEGDNLSKEMVSAVAVGSRALCHSRRGVFSLGIWQGSGDPVIYVESSRLQSWMCSDFGADVNDLMRATGKLAALVYPTSVQL